MECNEKLNIHQINKLDVNDLKRKDIFPITVTSAVFDKQGNSLESILLQNNSIFLSYKGSNEATRITVPLKVRRKGLIISYKDYDGKAITEKLIYDDTIADDIFKLDSSWTSIGDVVISGEISISPNGTWIIDGKDSGIKAVGPKGDNGLSPIVRATNNKLEYSYDGTEWTVISDYIAAWFRFEDNKIQISRDNKKTWTDLSESFTQNLYIKGYIATVSALPTNATQGDIYMVGPQTTGGTDYLMYIKDSTGWKNNGSFTSIAAGVVQEVGDSETEVMSQKAISSVVGLDNYPVFNTGIQYRIGDIVNYRGILYRFIVNHIGAWSESDVEESSMKEDLDKVSSQTNIYYNKYNLVQGSALQNLVWDTTRVSTGFIDCRFSSVNVMTLTGAYIYGYSTFDDNFKYIEYTISRGNYLSLPKGNYCRVIVAKDVQGTADVTPEDVHSKIFIGEDINISYDKKLVAIDYQIEQGGVNGSKNIVIETQSPTRVRTGFINALNQDIFVYPLEGICIKSYVATDKDYKFVNAQLFPSDNILPKGYIYRLNVVYDLNESKNITPEEVYPLLFIGKEAENKKVIQEMSVVLEDNKDLFKEAITDFVPKIWYLGTTIGEPLTTTTVTDIIKSKLIDVISGEEYLYSGKGGVSGRAWYILDENQNVLSMADADTIFVDELIIIPEGAKHLVVQTNDGSISVFKKSPFIAKIENDITDNKYNLLDSFKPDTPFLWSALSKMKVSNDSFTNIGFIGDSWTQGTENFINGVNQRDFQGYVKPLSKILQEKYGFGGLGWLDFSRDGGTGKMFGCCDMYEHWNYSFNGTVTGLDGSSNSAAPNCLGVCCAHTIFANEASLTLTFQVGYLDKFKICYYKEAHFKVSVNNGQAVEVTANSTDGWQETEFGVTGTDTTRVVITSMIDNCIIFGLNCYYGTTGVRCHKIGNRSITAANYLLMDANQWQKGIKSLNLSWASVLLAINDINSFSSPLTISDKNLITIVTNISNLIDRAKVACTNNGIVTCDFSVLGVDNIEDSRWVALHRLAEYEKKMAKDNGYGWSSTDKCIGTKKEEFTYTGTFSDEIHLNAIGSLSYAEHLYNSLFVV